ncbi:MAG TPA: squalene synthase HpnC [Silvibacterium sp.]|nr:squalene synthase HpnC [Silvibacterium sp.]
MSASTAELIEQGWAALPAEYRMPAIAPSVTEAQAWCERLAQTHYENFHVASFFLPKRLKRHFHAIYAYCRVSDDLGDETNNREQSLALLELWGLELDACYRGEARHPVFVALAETIRECDIPKQPFADLLVAFRRDQSVVRMRSMEEVFDYCHYSANPVGQLVLYACGYRDEERFRLSDFTCTALQLANFWQDVREDYARDRIYFPVQDMRRFGVDEAMIAQRRCTSEFRRLMRHEVEFARETMRKGLPLIGMVDRELAIDLDLFSRGGLEILRAIEERDYDVLSARPAISKSRKAALLLRALAGKFAGSGPARQRSAA